MSKVLVVDDSTTVLISLKRLLEENGHEVQTAKDGLAALSTVIGSFPDIILLDIGLPGLSGLDLCVAIRRMPGCADIPVVVVTGSNRQFDEMLAQKIGVDGYLQKPVNPALLLEMIAQLTKKKPANDLQTLNLSIRTMS